MATETTYRFPPAVSIPEYVASILLSISVINAFQYDSIHVRYVYQFKYDNIHVICMMLNM